jgi:uncharacterized protein (UPF0548 family)
VSGAADLSARRLSYAQAGATDPASDRWTPPAGFRTYERTVPIGLDWNAAAPAVLEWAVKTRSGFRVVPAARVSQGADFWLIASVGPLPVREPVRIVAVVEQPDRYGFAYGTLDGHPVSGEEAFVVHRGADGGVQLTLRSLTRPASGPWRAAFPALLVAQRWYRRRYLSALTSDGPRSV